MTMLVAVRLNPWLDPHYWRWRRVRERRTVAMIACMQCRHQLLAAVYSVAKNRRPAPSTARGNVVEVFSPSALTDSLNPEPDRKNRNEKALAVSISPF
jgi:hypothetical protein